MDGTLGTMSGGYWHYLDPAKRVVLLVEYTTSRRDVTNYSVVLVVEDGTEQATVRVYDCTHGRNEMHRYTRSARKQPAEPFNAGTLGEGMRAAIAAVKAGYEQMIEAWRRA
jgi:hypothetical protein